MRAHARDGVDTTTTIVSSMICKIIHADAENKRTVPRHTNYTNGLGFVDGPRGVAALLDVWGEKLGGPRAGV